jgi:hypothetical protein
MLATRDIGKSLSVDDTTLAVPTDPIFMSFGCRASVQLPSFITLFVHLQGFQVKVELVSPPTGGSKDLPPPLPKPHEDKDEEAKETDDGRWDGHHGHHGKKDQLEKNPSSVGATGGKGYKLVAMTEVP